MGIIISISGCKAVGKTTLINSLRKILPDIIIREGFRQTTTGFDMSIEEEFYSNERFYLEREIREYYEYRKQPNPVVLLRGPEDLEFYALHYPKLHQFEWDVEKNLSVELNEFRKCRSDYILYLDASPEIIEHRKMNDITKGRRNMSDWLTNWQPYLEKYIKENPKTTVLNTDLLNHQEVLDWTIHWMMDKLPSGKYSVSE